MPNVKTGLVEKECQVVEIGDYSSGETYSGDVLYSSQSGLMLCAPPMSLFEAPHVDVRLRLRVGKHTFKHIL